LAAASKASTVILISLVLFDLPISLSSNASPRDHSHSWTALIDGTKTDPAKCKAVVEAVFRDHFHSSQKHCLALAHTKDELGREALLIAHEEVRELMFSFIFFCGRYELQEGPPIHRSATAVVIAALDHGATQEYKDLFHEHSADGRGSEWPFESFVTSM
jgi:hypothetical protein